MIIADVNIQDGIKAAGGTDLHGASSSGDSAGTADTGAGTGSCQTGTQGSCGQPAGRCAACETTRRLSRLAPQHVCLGVFRDIALNSYVQVVLQRQRQGIGQGKLQLAVMNQGFNSRRILQDLPGDRLRL